MIKYIITGKKLFDNISKWRLMKNFQIRIIYLFFLAIVFVSCSKKEDNAMQNSHTNLKGEYIYRQHNESLIQEPLLFAERNLYPWEKNGKGKYPQITKEFFRCKGSSLNAVRLVQKESELLRYYDCGGSRKHSLPLREEKEFIYPVLIDLLNYLQDKTENRVVITSGHSCIDHNLYLDSSYANQTSKHLLGAEVDFYIQGLEDQPEKVLKLIKDYYLTIPKYKGLKEFEKFENYEKEDVNVSMRPVYNKEIFVKIFKKYEGRDFDNRHPYPYISIQVRYDWDLNEKVTYSWNKAFHNFHRF